MSGCGCDTCTGNNAMTGHGLATLKSIEAMLGRLCPPSECFTLSFGNSLSGIHQLVPVMPTRIFVVAYTLVVAGATTIQFGGGTPQAFRTFQGHGGTTAGTQSFATNGGISHASAAWPAHIFKTDPGEGITLNVQNAVQWGGHLSFFTGDVFLN